LGATPVYPRDANAQRLIQELRHGIDPLPARGASGNDNARKTHPTLRLFVMTLLAWLLGKVWRNLPTVGALWTANVLAAVVFGLGHLSTAVALGIPINAMVISYAIVVNGLMGVTFGWLYMKFGIEAAMVAHFCADIVVHVVGPYFVY
jgi:hypothetical protein